MSVAESMEILAPIDQVGWASACCGRGLARCARPARCGTARPTRSAYRCGSSRGSRPSMQLEERVVLRIDRQDAHVVLARERHERRCRRRSGIPCWRARCRCRRGSPRPSPAGRRRRRSPRARCRPARRPPPPSRRARRPPRCPLPDSASRKRGQARLVRHAPRGGRRSRRAVSASLRAVRMRGDGVNLEAVRDRPRSRRPRSCRPSRSRRAA